MAAAPDPGLQQQWLGVLDNPATKAALLTAGLKLMTGGWGGPASQFAEAAGQGLDAAGGVYAEQERVAQRDLTRSDRLSERAEDRSLKLQLQRERQQDRATDKASREEDRKARQAQAALNQLDVMENRIRTRLEKTSLLGDETDPGFVAEKDRAEKELERISVQKERLWGQISGGADAGAETSQISAPANAGGDSGLPAEGPSAANVGANLPGAQKQPGIFDQFLGTTGTLLNRAVGPSAVDQFLEKYPDEQRLRVLLSRPDKDQFLAKFGLTGQQLEQELAKRKFKSGM
jgi:hypothetical protein